MPTDTPPAALARYYAGLRAMSTVQRASRQEQLVAEGRALARAGLRSRHPQADAQEIEVRLVALLYGKAAAALVGPVPDDAVEPLYGFDV